VYKTWTVIICLFTSFTCFLYFIIKNGSKIFNGGKTSPTIDDRLIYVASC
jgi:hypothetical protein